MVRRCRAQSCGKTLLCALVFSLILSTFVLKLSTIPWHLEENSHVEMSIGQTQYITPAKTEYGNFPSKQIRDTDVVTTKWTNYTRHTLGKCDMPENTSPILARRFPHIIIIGFGRAGTRALYQMIRMHPDVVGPSNEIRFFSTNASYERGYRFYIRLLPPTNPRQRTIEKSPDYTWVPLAAPRLRTALSFCGRGEDIKFIVVVRDPYARTVCDYLHYNMYLHRNRKKELPPFEKMCVTKSGEINNLNNMINGSAYSYHLENWLKYFHLKQICFVSGERLVKDPFSEVQKLEKCLGLRSFIQPSHFYYNKMKGFYCPVDRQGKPKCLGPGKGIFHPKFNQEIEKKLRQFYQPFNQKLYNITGDNYNW